jgi:hypothetical protein
MHKSTTIVAERTEQTPNNANSKLNKPRKDYMFDVPLESNIIITYKKAHNTLAQSAGHTHAATKACRKTRRTKQIKSVDQTALGVHGADDENSPKVTLDDDFLLAGCKLRWWRRLKVVVALLWQAQLQPVPPFTLSVDLHL